MKYRPTSLPPLEPTPDNNLDMSDDDMKPSSLLTLTKVDLNDAFLLDVRNLLIDFCLLHMFSNLFI